MIARPLRRWMGVAVAVSTVTMLATVTYTSMSAETRLAKHNTLAHRARYRGFKLLPNADLKAVCNIQTNVQESVDGLVKSVGADWHWQWIMGRVKSLWPNWVKAAHSLEVKRPGIIGRTLKKMLVIPGVLTVTGYAKPSVIRAGGPLGDLLQWADLIAGLHVLGHHVHLHHNLFTASTHLLRNDFRGGPAECDQVPYHSIFIDILGFKQLSPDIHKGYRCKYRVVDAYGTHVMFNNPKYAATHGYTSSYGNLNLNLKQFYTYYPHSPDNSFLGFVTTIPENKSTKGSIALLYGKDHTYWENKYDYVKGVLNLNISVHATISKTYANILPPGVVFHDVVDSKKYQELLGNAKLLLAAGLPLESSGVMEALSHGTIIIQPQFTGKEQDALRGKPTSRKLTSEVPYLKEFIGPPYVYTIDITDQATVRKTIQTALKNQPEPFIPEEFTMVGFLDRLHHYLEHQNFCDIDAPLWPPLEALLPVQGSLGESCTETCSRHGRNRKRTSVCEPVYFKHINNIENLSKISKQMLFNLSQGSDIFYPAIDDVKKRIITQHDEALFSCEGSAEDLRRICPCRHALRHQLALCQECMDMNIY